MNMSITNFKISFVFFKELCGEKDPKFMVRTKLLVFKSLCHSYSLLCTCLLCISLYV